MLTILSPEIYTVCTLEVDPSVIPKDMFQRKIRRNGKPYFKIKYDILITIQSASILFEFEVNGTVYDGVKALYKVA